MAFRITRLFLLFALAHMTLASGQIKLFINQLPEYSSLAACAVFQVSTVVRDMEDGCGDGSRTTSYDCFCHTSSSYFSSFIGSKVEKACATDNPDLQKSSAVKLFDSYCHLGDSLTSVISSTISSTSPTSSAESSSATIVASVSASPASTPHMAIASASTNPLPSSTTKPPKDTHTPKKANATAVAVGITVPVSLIAAAAVAFFIFQRKGRQSRQVLAETNASTDKDDYRSMQDVQGVQSKQHACTTQSELYELEEDVVSMRFIEIDGRAVIAEMH